MNITSINSIQSIDSIASEFILNRDYSTLLSLVNSIRAYPSLVSLFNTREGGIVSANVKYKFNSSLPSIRIKLCSHWTNQLSEMWNKMSQNGQGKWNRIQIVPDSVIDDSQIDYYVIINSTNEPFIPKKSLVFHMEPLIDQRPQLWNQWANLDDSMFKFIGRHRVCRNTMEWHISLTWEQLQTFIPQKTKKRTCSVIVSSKYFDPGHQKRIDFLKYVEDQLDKDDSCPFELDIYGANNYFQFKRYRGPLPTYKKDDGLFPYEYTFNAENHSIYNYVTEKFTDAILSECCLFYWGCPNMYDYFPPQSFIYLHLEHPEYAYQVMKQSIQQDEYKKRLSTIKETKYKILNEYQFFPMLESILSQLNSENE